MSIKYTALKQQMRPAATAILRLLIAPATFE
jgi:hypothetical protein